MAAALSAMGSEMTEDAMWGCRVYDLARWARCAADDWAMWPINHSRRHSVKRSFLSIVTDKCQIISL